MNRETDQAAAPADSAQLTVYYDGACPLCSREIAHYRSMAGAEHIHWQDVADASSTHGDAKLADDLTREAALARMHVRDADGQLISGAAAFAQMWQMFPKTRWLGRVAATRPALWVLEPAYRGFLALRPLWRRKAG